MAKKIEVVREIIEKKYRISDMEWDSTAAAFYLEEGQDAANTFESLRAELKEKGYVAAIRKDEANSDIMETIDELATTPQLRDYADRIRNSGEPAVRNAWLEHFLSTVRCPDCGSNLNTGNGKVACFNCGWGKGKFREPRYVIVVTHQHRIRTRSIKVNIAMFIATILSTTITGSTLWMSYQGVPFDSFIGSMIAAMTTPEYLAMGALFFSVPLLTILGIHELGHYFTARYYGVNASLPFFIPLPPGISPLGTMGAFISMREPMPNKKALFDIGIAGPIAGLIVAIPVTILGFMLTEPVDHVYTAGNGPNVSIGFPYLFIILYNIFEPDGGIHPTAFAGWVGLFITALNLLPAGQLDGGHVARALLGERSKYLSYATLGGMVLVGVFVYPAWLILGLLIILLGAYHPPPLNDMVKLDLKRKSVGIFSIVLLVLCFTPQPMVPLEYDLHVFTETNEADIVPGNNVNFTIILENTGQVNNTYDITNASVPEFWNISYSTDNITLTPKEDNKTLSKGFVDISISAPANATPRKTQTIRVRVKSQNESADTFGSSTPEEVITFKLHVINPYDLNMEIPKRNLIIAENQTNTSVVYLNNTGNLGLNIALNYSILAPGENSEYWNVSLSEDRISLESGESGMVSLNISADAEAEGESVSVLFSVFSQTPEGNIRDSAFIDVSYPEE